jgi:SAM-dependent methyltransferase
VFLEIPCPVCAGKCKPLDVVDFNKSCEEERGKYLPLVGHPIYYCLCEECAFCFAPEFFDWTLEDFEAKIYNSDYVVVDPDYVENRPRSNAQNMVEVFGEAPSAINHLDYGGGNGLLSSILRDRGWKSATYDPFVDRRTKVDQLGKFNLITAFEVFEHVPDVTRLASDLATLLEPEGVVFFSTMVSDNEIAPHKRLGWWYASPRNGHISLFSSQSLHVLAESNGWNFGSFSPNFHSFWSVVPEWASGLIKAD